MLRLCVGTRAFSFYIYRLSSGPAETTPHFLRSRFTASTAAKRFYCALHDIFRNQCLFGEMEQRTHTRTLFYDSLRQIVIKLLPPREDARARVDDKHIHCLDAMRASRED
jgi:hypothetical protein